jgi:hypothetical protein
MKHRSDRDPKLSSEEITTPNAKRIRQGSRGGKRHIRQSDGWTPYNGRVIVSTRLTAGWEPYEGWTIDNNWVLHSTVIPNTGSKSRKSRRSSRSTSTKRS